MKHDVGYVLAIIIALVVNANGATISCLQTQTAGNCTLGEATAVAITTASTVESITSTANLSAATIADNTAKVCSTAGTSCTVCMLGLLDGAPASSYFAGCETTESTICTKADQTTGMVSGLVKLGTKSFSIYCCKVATCNGNINAVKNQNPLAEGPPSGPPPSQSPKDQPGTATRVMYPRTVFVVGTAIMVAMGVYHQ